MGFNDEPSDELFSDDMLDQMTALLNQGLEAVQGDAVRMWRVHKALLSPRYVRIRRDIKRGKTDIQAINAFFADWRAPYDPDGGVVLRRTRCAACWTASRGAWIICSLD